MSDKLHLRALLKRRMVGGFYTWLYTVALTTYNYFVVYASMFSSRSRSSFYPPVHVDSTPVVRKQRDFCVRFSDGVPDTSSSLSAFKLALRAVPRSRA